MHRTVKSTLKHLHDHGHKSFNRSWQSIEISKNNPVIEVRNVTLKFDDIVDPVESFCPDLPWAEDHFLERVNGEPINPGEQYKNWPYYKAIDNDELFRKSTKFSHNYMERYWCKGFNGIRYQYGDLMDIIDRLKTNIHTRQAFLAVWHPEDQSNNNVRVPCTIGYWFNYRFGQLNVTYLIRSCDAVRHFKNDLYLTYRLLQYVASKVNETAGELDVWIGSFHCFESDLYTIKKLIK